MAASALLVLSLALLRGGDELRGVGKLSSSDPGTCVHLTPGTCVHTRRAG
jgi:hypothetical protein